MTFLDKLVRNCEQYADKVAIEFVGDEGTVTAVTYRQLEQTVLQTMAYLQAKGVQPGDRIALQLPKCLPFIYLHLAIMRLEAISLPLNPGYPAHELHYFLQDAEAKLFFADETAQSDITPILPDLPSLQECIFLDTTSISSLQSPISNLQSLISSSPPANIPIPQDPNATCLMIYTSGTTGRPKGAELTHGNLTANLNSLHEAWGWRDDDVLLHVLPIFHVHGLIVALHGALNAGATAVLHPAFNAEKTLQTLQDRQCTVFMAVPTIHRRLVNTPNAASCDLSHMRLLTSGSDRLPDDLFKAYQETFGHTLLERYGMSETSMLVSNPLHGERRVGSVGLPLPGVEVRIVHPETEGPLPDNEVGEVQVRGANVCKGYWRQPEKTAAAFTVDGWLRTGDLGLRQPDGYFTLKGRSKDLIISGGYNIYPPEVELVLAGHPAVQASAVIGCPDAEWGERVTAVIIPQPHIETTKDSIIAHCKNYLVNYKVPRQVLFVEEFPRNSLGKIQKAKLRQNLCG
jgi:malonyl-CoA/methylmalonyl-CoA synthetase